MKRCKVTIIGKEKRAGEKKDGKAYEIHKLHITMPEDGVQGASCATVFVDPAEYDKAVIGRQYDACVEYFKYRPSSVCLL